MGNGTHPATHIKTKEGEEENLHNIQYYTHISKRYLDVRVGVVIFLHNIIKIT